MKKLMILGGSENQLPLIKCAKQLGYYIVLCDYSEDNLGKKYADVFHCVSTLDRKAVLEVAKNEKIDGIVTNSEPAMLTSSYVGNELEIPSNPYESIAVLSRKDLFRSFLSKNGFNCPNSHDTDNYEFAIDVVSEFEFPLMVKPVDSSGSRGVNKIYSIDDLEDAFHHALQYSKAKRVMIEEYIEKTHEYMVGGDIFVLNGEVAFWGLMNCLRDNTTNTFVPVGKSFPAFITNEQYIIIENTINSIIKQLNIKFGAFNIELMFGDDNRLFMIEMNPRNGGNRIPEVLKTITGVDLIKATIEAAIGTSNLNLAHDITNKFVSTYILHSEFDGLLKGISYNEKIKGNIQKINLEKKIGDTVEKFNSADKLVGIIFLEFSNLEEMKYKLEHIKELIELDVEL